MAGEESRQPARAGRYTLFGQDYAQFVQASRGLCFVGGSDQVNVRLNDLRALVAAALRVAN